MQEHIHHLKKHRNVLYSLVSLLVVLQVISFFILSSHIVKLNSELEKSRTNFADSISGLEKIFQTKLDDSDVLHQQNFNELSKAFLAQQEVQSNIEKDITLLKSSSGDFSEVINRAVRSVVSVGTEKTSGTGFIISPDGYIITNHHVIARAQQIAALTYDKRVISARLIGYDSNRDIALLKIQGEYDYLELADSDDLNVGQKVIAIGNPLGLSFTVTEGIISALDREGPNGLEEYIQTDVSLNPGNSGGPLIDTRGKVIGVNNFKLGNAESLGFALESNMVRQVVNEKIANKTIIS